MYTQLSFERRGSIDAKVGYLIAIQQTKQVNAHPFSSRTPRRPEKSINGEYEEKDQRITSMETMKKRTREVHQWRVCEERPEKYINGECVEGGRRGGGSRKTRRRRPSFNLNQIDSGLDRLNRQIPASYPRQRRRRQWCCRQRCHR